MKINYKTALMASMVLAGQLFALEVEMSKDFTIGKTTDRKSTDFRLEVQRNGIANKTVKEDIDSLFRKAIEISKESSICKGGKYNIYPYNVRYNNKGPMEKGYKGSITFTCEFDEENDYAALLSKIKAISPDLKLSEGNINYILNASQIEQNSKLLESMAYAFSKEHANFISRETSLSCIANKISISNSNYSPVHYQREALRSSQSLVTSPIDNDVTQKLNARFTFTCQ